jgi:hypothetical protein
VATNDVSPYLQRPVRTLEEVMAEVEQQRLGTPAAAIAVVIPPSTAGDASSADGSAASKERI